MQFLKDAAARAGIGGQVDHAQLLTCAGLFSGLAHVLGQAQLAGAQKDQSPGQTRAGSASAARAAFALPVRQHVGGIADHLAVHLPHFVKAQQRIGILHSHAFDAVVGCAPSLHVLWPAHN